MKYVKSPSATVRHVNTTWTGGGYGLTKCGMIITPHWRSADKSKLRDCVKCNKE